nr:hypothetical protein [Escherichia coli]UNB13119.1 hypothetical protein [Escherichia coli]UNB13344.1 hypothetical protein [Escherichia coli]
MVKDKGSQKPQYQHFPFLCRLRRKHEPDHRLLLFIFG